MGGEDSPLSAKSSGQSQSRTGTALPTRQSIFMADLMASADDLQAVGNWTPRVLLADLVVGVGGLVGEGEERNGSQGRPFIMHGIVASALL